MLLTDTLSLSCLQLWQSLADLDRALELCPRASANHGKLEGNTRELRQWQPDVSPYNGLLIW
jgi:hypothetical protein